MPAAAARNRRRRPRNVVRRAERVVAVAADEIAGHVRSADEQQASRPGRASSAASSLRRRGSGSRSDLVAVNGVKMRPGSRARNLRARSRRAAARLRRPSARLRRRRRLIAAPVERAGSSIPSTAGRSRGRGCTPSRSCRLARAAALSPVDRRIEQHDGSARRNPRCRDALLEVPAVLPVRASSATTDALNRLSPARTRR